MHDRYDKFEYDPNFNYVYKDLVKSAFGYGFLYAVEIILGSMQQSNWLVRSILCSLGLLAPFLLNLFYVEMVLPILIGVVIVSYLFRQQAFKEIGKFYEILNYQEQEKQFHQILYNKIPQFIFIVQEKQNQLRFQFQNMQCSQIILADESRDFYLKKICAWKRQT